MVYLSLLFFLISLAIAILFVRAEQENMCLLCKVIAYLSSLSALYWFLKVFENFASLWLLAIPIIIGTIYLFPEYIKSYKEGKARRKRKKEHDAIHRSLVRGQGRD